MFGFHGLQDVVMPFEKLDLVVSKTFEVLLIGVPCIRALLFGAYVWALIVGNSHWEHGDVVGLLIETRRARASRSMSRKEEAWVRNEEKLQTATPQRT